MATCARCHRGLRDEVSVMRGYGPVCWAKLETSRRENDGSGVYDGGDIILRRTEFGVETNVPRRVVRHSPSGFEFGYGGSGPADLALNILLLFVDQRTAESLYQDFKWEFVATVPREGGIIKRDDIVTWLRQQGCAVKGGDGREMPI